MICTAGDMCALTLPRVASMVFREDERGGGVCFLYVACVGGITRTHHGSDGE